MDAHSLEAIRRHVKVYLLVFGALAVLTVVTVAVSYLELPLVPAVGLALAIATLKASLVAAFFMHLSSERRVILVLLAFTMFFFAFLLVYPALDRY